MRVLVEYTREERVKYISHLDLMRTMQRAVRRAGIPIAYSQGFNPHPVMAFASALPVGVTSEKEYMDIVLEQPMSLPVLKEQLNHALPKGIAVREAVVIEDKTPSMMSLIKRADYKVTAAGVDWNQVIEAYTGASEILVEKKSKKGVTTINLKDAVYNICKDEENGEVLHLSLKVGDSSGLNPLSAVNALLKLSGAAKNEGIDLTAAVHRTGMYLIREGQWVTPLALNID
ncbi:MAG TPA: DUF2344 domain-containing protein [Clostridiales bacterium]|nr:DUF2344 domain-containing protein [Clostridiales bacterium]